MNQFKDLQKQAKDLQKIAMEKASSGSMTEEELEEFQQSQEYQTYKIDMDGNETSELINAAGKNVQEIFKLSGKTDNFSHNCIDFLSIDHEDYLDTVDFSPEMQATLAEGNELLPTFKYLHEDIFMSLYQYDVEVLPKEKMHSSSWFNRAIMEELINSPTYIALRQACNYDLFNAGVGTEIIGKEAIKILREELSKINDYQEKKEKLDTLMKEEEQMDTLLEERDDILEEMEEMEMLENTDSEEYERLQGELEELEDAIAEGRGNALGQASDCDELIDPNEDMITEVSMSIDNSIVDSTKEVEEVSSYVEAWGLGTGQKTKVPFSMKRNAIEKIRNSPKLQEFTDMIGRYKDCAMQEQKKKIRNSAVEIKSVKTGDKIEDALPSDKLNLCNETTKRDFYRRMTQGQLISYDKESQKQKNKGPIIVCLDVSGSMQGDKETWSKALAVGILEVAQIQKRDFACIPYDGRLRPVTIIEKNEINPDKIIGIAEEQVTGGTDFERPLEKALELIEEDTFKEADIVFLTDGDCWVSKEFERKFNRVKEDKEFKTLGILVDYGHTSDSALKGFCDSIQTVSDIANAKVGDSEANRQIFASL